MPLNKKKKVKKTTFPSMNENFLLGSISSNTSKHFPKIWPGNGMKEVIAHTLNQI